MDVFAIGLAEADTQFPRCTPTEYRDACKSVIYVNSMQLFLSRYLRHLNFICTDPRKEKKPPAISPGGIFSRLARQSARQCISQARAMAPSWSYLSYNPVVRRRREKEGFRRAMSGAVTSGVPIETSSGCTTLHRRRISLCGCACARDAINISFPAPISFGFQCKCKTARNSRWQVTRLADGTPAASLQRLHKTRRAALLTAES